jgi:hypothetical protein
MRHFRAQFCARSPIRIKLKSTDVRSKLACYRANAKVALYGTFVTYLAKLGMIVSSPELVLMFSVTLVLVTPIVLLQLVVGGLAVIWYTAAYIVLGCWLQTEFVLKFTSPTVSGARLVPSVLVHIFKTIPQSQAYYSTYNYLRLAAALFKRRSPSQEPRDVELIDLAVLVLTLLLLLLIVSLKFLLSVYVGLSYLVLTTSIDLAIRCHNTLRHLDKNAPFEAAKLLVFNCVFNLNTAILGRINDLAIRATYCPVRLEGSEATEARIQAEIDELLGAKRLGGVLQEADDPVLFKRVSDLYVELDASLNFET